jgi:hypothetical protein
LISAAKLPTRDPARRINRKLPELPARRFLAPRPQ